MGTLPLPPQFTFIHPGRMCWVAGWGKTDVKEPASSTLQEVELRIVEPRVCSLFPAFDHSLQLCVGHHQSTKSAFKVILRLRSSPQITVHRADTFGRRWEFGVSASDQCEISGLRTETVPLQILLPRPHGVSDQTLLRVRGCCPGSGGARKERKQRQRHITS